MSEETKQSDQDVADEWAAALEEAAPEAGAEEDPWAAALEEQATEEQATAALECCDVEMD